MFSFPNSLAKLCDKARLPNLPAANALVVLIPRIDAVAPVKINDPLAPFSPISFFKKVVIASRENAKAALMLTSTLCSISSSVVSKKDFHTR